MTPQLEDYIERHISPEPSYLRAIDRDTQLHYINGRMCSGHIQGRLLKMLAAMIRPKKTLELGTFTGYSALCVAEALEAGATIDTVEADDELEEVISKNLSSSPHGAKVKLHICDALDFLARCTPDSYDLAIIDADKRQYPQYFKAVKKIVRPGGYIIADNTLWDGHVAETGNHSSQTRGVMEFNDLVAADPDFETAIIPIRDGLTIIKRLK